MMEARIYQPAKTAMQSGRARTRNWILEFEPSSAKKLDPLMGWVGSSAPLGQVRLCFDTREAAVAFAERNHLAYVVVDSSPRRIRPKNYSDNFRPGSLA